MDVELAKSQASKPEEEDVELRKKLWLRIGLSSLSTGFLQFVVSHLLNSA